MILRPSVIFGNEDGFFNRFGGMAGMGPVLPLVGGNTKFQPVYVDDVAQAAALGITGAARGIYELGGPDDETFKVIESLRKSDIIGKHEIKHYVNFVVGLDAESLRQVAELPDVISIHPYIEPQKFDEAQSLILRGNLNGNLPTPGDYLQYLLGKGFTQAQFDSSSFAVDVTDSGVGNANPANENQFLLRRQGDPAQARPPETRPWRRCSAADLRRRPGGVSPFFPDQGQAPGATPRRASRHSRPVEPAWRSPCIARRSEAVPSV